MNKRLGIAIGIIVALFIGVAWIGGDKSSDAVVDTSSGARPTHSIGETDVKVTLVEYSDFQCPACRAYYSIVEKIIQKYKDQISFEYRHYLLTTIHRNAFAAARASEAAGEQNKFWEMYRQLFENQPVWEDADNAQMIFEGYAQSLGLDMAKYKIDFVSRDTNRAINASIAEFNRQGLTKATPTFLLNGRKIQPRNAEDFSKLIDEQLKLSSQR